MQSPDTTERRSFTWRLLAAFVIPFSLACDEPKLLQPALGDPANVEPTRFEFIFLAEANGNVLGRLTEGSWPSWSPDGRRIVFQQGGDVSVIGVYDLEDGLEVALAAGRWPTWSPDGSRIAYATPEGISVVNADGSGTRPLMSPALGVDGEQRAGDAGKLSWSPDGSLIAFDEPSVYADGSRASIFAMTSDGTRQFRLAGDSEYETEPSWSPTGSVVYWSTKYGIGVIDRSGGPTVQLYKDATVAFDARPVWSPDGSTIAFNTGLPVPSIMTIPSSGGSPTKLIQDGYQAAWSPDGRRLAFVRLQER